MQKFFGQECSGIFRRLSKMEKSQHASRFVLEFHYVFVSLFFTQPIRTVNLTVLSKRFLSSLFQSKSVSAKIKIINFAVTFDMCLSYMLSKILRHLCRQRFAKNTRVLNSCYVKFMTLFVQIDHLDLLKPVFLVFWILR